MYCVLAWISPPQAVELSLRTHLLSQMDSIWYIPQQAEKALFHLQAVAVVLHSPSTTPYREISVALGYAFSAPVIVNSGLDYHCSLGGTFSVQDYYLISKLGFEWFFKLSAFLQLFDIWLPLGVFLPDWLLDLGNPLRPHLFPAEDDVSSDEMTYWPVLEKQI